MRQYKSWIFLVMFCASLMFCQYSIRGIEASSNLTREITIPAESCIQSPVRQNVTLKGGIEAGIFKKIAQFVAIQLCIRMCCDQKGCDVALLSGKNCYGVQCFSEELCEAVPAKKAPSSLMISHVTIKGERGMAITGNLSNPIPHNLKCTVTEPEYGVTLTGGLKAGNFTDVGKVESVNACTRLCCVSEKCNLALIIKGNCFLVSCFTEDLCKTVKTETKNYRPTVAYVKRWTTALALESALTLSTLPDTDSKLSCKNSDIRHNFTLKGGYRAGNFTDLGKVSNMSTCIRYCCGRKDCDVAMVLELSCYAVHCFSEKLCKPVTARKSGILSYLNPQLSYITSRNEEVLTKRIPLEDGAFCQPSVISYDVTLKGGVKAGSFTPLGQVDSIQTCISLCCQRPSCDVAFMLKNTCYSIKCSSEDACEQVPARVSEYSPRLSYVRRYTDNNITKEKKLTMMGYLTKANETSPNADTSEDHYCTESETIYNVTLRGGITSGRFRDRGKIPTIQECAEICCIAKECDLAFMLKKHCFSVSCFSQSLCEAVKAKSSVFNPTIVYIYARTINDIKGMKRRNERIMYRSATAKTYGRVVKESDIKRRLKTFEKKISIKRTRKRRKHKQSNKKSKTKTASFLGS